MSYVIKILDLLDASEDAYLTEFDPEFTDTPGTYPTGLAESSPNLDEAIKFDSFEDAMTVYRMQSKTVPWRPDGRPNRPLCALSVEISFVKD